MIGKKIFYYRHNKDWDTSAKENRYQLLELPCNIPRVIVGFPRLRDLKRFIKTRFPGAELKEYPEEERKQGESSPLEVDHIYMPLDGEAIRGLTWGMSRKKVARKEQIDGGECVLIKEEFKNGFAIKIRVGFDEWAQCGLEYIAYSSQFPAFLNSMEQELTAKYGSSELVVDFHGLDRLLKEKKITDREMLRRFIKDPENHQFNPFIGLTAGLTFRSARKWNNRTTTILLYKQWEPYGERNRQNLPYVVEFWPLRLFEFYQERFAELYLG